MNKISTIVTAFNPSSDGSVSAKSHGEGGLGTSLL